MIRRIFILLVVAVVAVGCYAGWYLFSHGFTARVRPGPVETGIARRLRHLATPAAARERKNPLEATMLAIAEGRDHYADHCAPCHANDGSGRTYMNEGLYPPAPDMRLPATRQLTDGELFYIIQQGVPMTGMPGWGGEDEENWKLVLFVRHLPDLSAKEIELMQELNHQPPPEAPGSAKE